MSDSAVLFVLLVLFITCLAGLAMEVERLFERRGK